MRSHPCRYTDMYVRTLRHTIHIRPTQGDILHSLMTPQLKSSSTCTITTTQGPNPDTIADLLWHIRYLWILVKLRRYIDTHMCVLCCFVLFCFTVQVYCSMLYSVLLGFLSEWPLSALFAVETTQKKYVLQRVLTF